MKNKSLLLFSILLIIQTFTFKLMASEVFNFDVTEVEILDDGNKFLGKKRGTATNEDGTVITADNFIYDKLLNILEATGNVIVFEPKKNTKIFSEKIIYLKKDEIIFTKTRSKITDEIKTIDSDEFEYKKNLDILKAKGNVEIIDREKNYRINAEEITYLKKIEEIYTKGKTSAIIESKYDFQSKNVLLLRNKMQLSSSEKSTIKDDDDTVYKLDKFIYFIDEEILKGESVNVITNFSKPKSDNIYFSNGIFNFRTKNFSSKDTKITLHKELFDNERIIKLDISEKEKKRAERFMGKNDPRIYGVSSSGNQYETLINKGVFTSCKRNNTCPPWSLKANKITHDKVKQNISYKNAFLNVYDIPVFYFPKFFHPDPSVKRRSGFLQPRLNSSNIVGTSLNMPYFHVISENKDFTFKPTIFDNRIYMFQNEYRQVNEKSKFIADFGYTKGYKSSLSSNRNGMSHFFSKFNMDLDLENYSVSKLDFFVEKVSMDTFLKIFDNNLLTDESLSEDLKNHNTLKSGIELSLDHEDFNLTSGITSYESLQSNKNSDRYEYVLPYYDFSKNLFSDYRGSINLTSNGNNTLNNTNKIKSVIANNLNYLSKNIYSKSGFVTNYGIYFKNLNSVGKKNSEFKSSPRSEIFNINEFSFKYPLSKEADKDNEYLTPKISLRLNPSDMKNYSNTSRLVTADNVFGINRLGLSESFESGKTITLGLDYKREDKYDLDKYLEVKFATVFRDVPEYKIPNTSSLQGKNSNIFGSIENKFSENLTFDYNFSIDNDLTSFEYNNFKTEINFENMVTEFNFTEMNGKVGDTNYIENKTKFYFDENHSLIFKTRRNRKISLTEYYDFIYEYETDCLTAAIKYKKTYYQDRDLIPKEDLFLTLTLFPLTSLDQKIDKKLYRDNNNDIIWK